MVGMRTDGDAGNLQPVGTVDVAANGGGQTGGRAGTDKGIDGCGQQRARVGLGDEQDRGELECARVPRRQEVRRVQPLLYA